MNFKKCTEMNQKWNCGFFSTAATIVSRADYNKYI